MSGAGVPLCGECARYCACVCAHGSGGCCAPLPSACADGRPYRHGLHWGGMGMATCRQSGEAQLRRGSAGPWEIRGGAPCRRSAADLRSAQPPQTDRSARGRGRRQRSSLQQPHTGRSARGRRRQRRRTRRRTPASRGWPRHWRRSGWRSRGCRSSTTAYMQSSPWWSPVCREALATRQASASRAAAMLAPPWRRCPRPRLLLVILGRQRRQGLRLPSARRTRSPFRGAWWASRARRQLGVPTPRRDSSCGQDALCRASVPWALPPRTRERSPLRMLLLVIVQWMPRLPLRVMLLRRRRRLLRSRASVRAAAAAAEVDATPRSLRGRGARRRCPCRSS